MARPNSNYPRIHQYRLRLNDVEKQMLTDLETKWKKPKSWILRYFIYKEWLDMKVEE